MKRGQKLKTGLDRRVELWMNMVSSGSKGPNTKLVRREKGTAAYHKPGSQNGRKGYGRKSARR